MTLPGSVVEVSSWYELLDALHSPAIVQDFAEEGGHRRSPYVFRGVGNALWTLDTSLHRLLGAVDNEVVHRVEEALIRNFRKYANAGAFEGQSEWFVLAVGQHNGLPTRCLDWTTSPLVAAHFACANEAHKNSPGIIWCLEAGLLREINRRNEPEALKSAWVYDTQRLTRTFPHGLDDLTASPNDIMLLWEPPSIDARIANQSGMLSILNNPAASQTDYLRDHAEEFPDLLRRIVIAPEAKSEIRDMLDQNNISERTLFPGLPGLCDWLRRYYGRAW